MGLWQVSDQAGRRMLTFWAHLAANSQAQFVLVQLSGVPEASEEISKIISIIQCKSASKQPSTGTPGGSFFFFHITQQHTPDLSCWRH